jgi:hypothetical protein
MTKFEELGSHLPRILELIKAQETTRSIPRILGCSRTAFREFLWDHPELCTELRANYAARRSEVGRRNAQQVIQKRLSLPIEEQAALARERVARAVKGARVSAALAREKSRQKWAGLMPKVYELINAGQSVQEIADETGIDFSVIYDRLKIDPRRSELMTRLRQTRWEHLHSPEYRALHCELARKEMKDPEVIRKLSEATKKKWLDPSFRQAAVQVACANWERPEYRARMERLWNDPKHRAMLAAHIAEQRKDPVFIAACRNRDTSFMKDPEHLALMSEVMKKWWSTRDFWAWVDTFPPEKKKQILCAIHAGRATAATNWKRYKHDS